MRLVLDIQTLFSNTHIQMHTQQNKDISFEFMSTAHPSVQIDINVMSVLVLQSSLQDIILFYSFFLVILVHFHLTLCATVELKSSFLEAGDLRQSQQAELLFTDPEYFSCVPVQLQDTDCRITATSRDYWHRPIWY